MWGIIRSHRADDLCWGIALLQGHYEVLRTNCRGTPFAKLSNPDAVTNALNGHVVMLCPAREI